MNLLIIGSGGREHALAWKLCQSPVVDRIFVAPGNGGTATLPCCENIAIGAGNLTGLLDFAHRQQVGLTVVGPEAPLVDGIVDLFEAEGRRICGPTREAAQLEGSKAFAKQFMQQYGIPTAESRVAQSFDEALALVRGQEPLPVIKVSGLAAGKGVYVPETLAEAEIALREIYLDERFGPERQEVVIEERLYGPELSVLAFCDGRRFRLMPAGQDHKRLYDGDTGPNTGGMGAYAPAPLASPELMQEVAWRVFEPTLAGMAARGTPYRGILYAGLMITQSGIKVLEFNCRFGDPETQGLLPLLESDLLPLLTACADGSLAEMAPRWRDATAATVVMAARGYPERYARGTPIYGMEEAAERSDVLLFHAGTTLRGDQLVTDGGRVLAVTGTGPELQSALNRAYNAISYISFEGAHYRRDIGAKAYM